MEIDLFAVGVLIPAIPLLMVNFGNRYASMSALIRKLHAHVVEERASGKPMSEETLEREILEIARLRRRLTLNRFTQFAIGAAFLLDIVAISLIVVGYSSVGAGVFVAALILIALSMISYLVEIAVSANALDLHLQDLET